MEVDIYKMLYKASNNDLRILGNIFVKNNKNKGKLIINNKKQKISEFINFISVKDNEYKIKLLLTKNIHNKSYFFKDCITLLKLSTSNIRKITVESNIKFINGTEQEILYDEINTKKEIDSQFYDEEANNPNINISEISKTEKNTTISSIKFWNNNLESFSSNNFFNFEEMFSNCSSLNYLSDIFQSENKIINMRYIFYECKSLESLPDISGWNIEDVTDISSLF